jgi:hypothetical protein
MVDDPKDRIVVDDPPNFLQRGGSAQTEVVAGFVGHGPGGGSSATSQQIGQDDGRTLFQWYLS